jgi:hypothetical protein
MPKPQRHRRGLANINQQIRNQSTRLLETGSRFDRFDQIRQRHFWSMYYFAADANGYVQSGNFPIFVTPPGQNGQGFPSGITLSERETNWKSQNRVPDNQNFEITELGVSAVMLTPDMLAAINGPANIAGIYPNGWNDVPPLVFKQFLDNTVLSITYLTNSVPLGLISDFAQASAPHAGTFQNNFFDTQTFNAGGVFRSNGMPAPALRRRFKIPILLQHGETFSFAFNIPRTFFIGKSTGANAIQGGNTVRPTYIGPVILRMDFWATESFVEKS